MSIHHTLHKQNNVHSVQNGSTSYRLEIGRPISNYRYQIFCEIPTDISRYRDREFIKIRIFIEM